MTTTVQSIIEYLGSQASSAPLTELQLNALVADLKSQINQLSVAVPGAQPGATTLLYSGWVGDGLHSGAVAEAISAANPEHVLTINKTDTASLLDSTAFKDALLEALGNDTDAYNRILIGTDTTNTTRIASDSLWDDASRRFAEAATGDVRTLTPLNNKGQTTVYLILHQACTTAWTALNRSPMLASAVLRS